MWAFEWSVPCRGSCNSLCLEIISVLVLGGLGGQQEPKHLDLMVKCLTKSLFLRSVTRLCDFCLL